MVLSVDEVMIAVYQGNNEYPQAQQRAMAQEEGRFLQGYTKEMLVSFKNT